MLTRGGFVALASVFLLGTAPAPAGAQGSGAAVPPADPPRTAVTPPILTLFTVPSDAEVTLEGDAEVGGRTPLDLPSSVTGRYTIQVKGAGFSRTHGVIFLPPRGGLPFVLSEPREGSMGLFVRGLSYPGVPALTNGHEGRGAVLLVAATSGLLLATRAHFSHRDRLHEIGDFAADRSVDERRYRDGWLLYSGGVWVLSAVDYWIRSRLDLSETTPTRLTLDVPRVSRVGAVWRSLVVPGAGQEFGNHRTRSVLWLGATLLSAAGYVVADYHVRRDETDVKWAQISVDSAGPSELPQRQLELDQERRDLSSSEDTRRGFLIATASLYVLNVLDAIIMPLTYPAPIRPRVASIDPVFRPDAAGLAVRIRF